MISRTIRWNLLKVSYFEHFRCTFRGKTVKIEKFEFYFYKKNTTELETLATWYTRTLLFREIVTFQTHNTEIKLVRDINEFVQLSQRDLEEGITVVVDSKWISTPKFGFNML